MILTQICSCNFACTKLRYPKSYTCRDTTENVDNANLYTTLPRWQFTFSGSKSAAGNILDPSTVESSLLMIFHSFLSDFIESYSRGNFGNFLRISVDLVIIVIMYLVCIHIKLKFLRSRTREKINFEAAVISS